MENETRVKCARCGRRLKHPKFVGGVPYGSVCVKKILKGIVLANPGMSLKDAEGFLGQTNESKGDTMVVVTEPKTDIINT
jgi:hypothetical protein